MPHRTGLSGPPRIHAHGHGPEWIVSVQDDVSRELFARHLGALADALKDHAEVVVNGTTISVPENVEFALRFERMPHGELALMIRAEWIAEGTNGSYGVPAAGLTIGPADGARA
jgi:hypothetical protein